MVHLRKSHQTFPSLEAIPPWIDEACVLLQVGPNAVHAHPERAQELVDVVSHPLLTHRGR
jgi:hypothetical protein